MPKVHSKVEVQGKCLIKCCLTCVHVCALQARAQVEAAKQQLVLLEAEADGARIRGQAEAQAAEVSRAAA